ncbi:HAD family hydrolase [Halalkalirubrum salinum]|uniref:HAD family hydrolase n=1 Tax=Halalkalirubrum salinum TaxID=2563889 RepID=UPI0010FB0EA8|nr:HAD family hydrolase [Halalkalirubrum salinum]
MPRTGASHTIRTETVTNAVLFDMDGVILKGRGSDPDIHTEALLETIVDYEIDPPASVLAALDTYEYTDEFIDACEVIDVDPVAFYADREAASAKFAIERLRAGERGLYPDVEALESIAETATVALVSNNYHPTVTFVAEHFGLDLFSFVRGRDLGVEGFTRRKPEPDYLLEALDALCVSAGYYVGDRETDVIAARRAGLKPVFLRRSHNEDVELGAKPAVEIDSLDELLAVLNAEPA